MAFRYLVFFQGDRAIGGAPCQILEVDFRRSYRPQIPPRGLQKLLTQWISSFQYRVLVCGNSAITGSHGYWFIELEESQQVQVLEEGMQVLQDQLNQEGLRITGTFIKDYDPREYSILTDYLTKRGYQGIEFQPAMDLPLDPSWTSIDDYLEALSSKYRVRFRRARKKAKGLQRLMLNLEDIEREEERIFALYKEVADAAELNVIFLPKNYFSNLKRHLGDRFRLKGYYLDHELVGFCSAIISEEGVEAHYLGFTEEVNHRTQLYLNILFSLVEMGIAAKAPVLHFARTAMEIKSSVGAQPIDLRAYFKFRNPVWRWLFKQAYSTLQPEAPTWKQRHPFK